jgi:hypothetical protein
MSAIPEFCFRCNSVGSVVKTPDLVECQECFTLHHQVVWNLEEDRVHAGILEREPADLLLFATLTMSDAWRWTEQFAGPPPPLVPN